jgi:predicted Zn-dependent protease
MGTFTQHLDAGEGAMPSSIVQAARAAGFVAILALAACGPQRALPSPDAAALAAAQQELSAAEPLREYPRGPGEQQAMLQRVVQKLTPAVQQICQEELGRACSFRIGIADQPAINAFASGTDTVGITSGLIRVMDSDDQLAVVVAHEMAHHIADHISSTRTRTTLGALAGAALGTAAGIGDLSALGASVGRLSYSKAQEREADFIAARIVDRAGYDLDEAGSVWAKFVGAGDKRRVAGLLDTHPAGPERLAAWNQTVDAIQASPDAPETREDRARR